MQLDPLPIFPPANPEQYTGAQLRLKLTKSPILSLSCCVILGKHFTLWSGQTTSPSNSEKALTGRMVEELSAQLRSQVAWV